MNREIGGERHAALVERAQDPAGAGGRDQHDIRARGQREVGVEEIESVGEHQRGSAREGSGDLGPQRGERFVGEQARDHAGPPRRLGERERREARRARPLLGGVTGPRAHHDREPGVAEIERLGLSLMPVAQHRHGGAPETLAHARRAAAPPRGGAEATSAGPRWSGSRTP